ncbi:hypothetical protein ACSBR1_008245 [Camellia fascicularis]
MALSDPSPRVTTPQVSREPPDKVTHKDGRRRSPNWLIGDSKVPAAHNQSQSHREPSDALPKTRERSLSPHRFRLEDRGGTTKDPAMVAVRSQPESAPSDRKIEVIHGRESPQS